MTADPTGDAVVGSARNRAAEIVADLRVAAGGRIEVGGVDLGPALEQQIYFALRDRRIAARGVRAVLGRELVGAAALVASLRPVGRPRLERGGILVIMRGVVHARAFAPVAAEIDRRGGPPATIVRVGQAAASRDPAVRTTPRIVDLLRPRRAAAAFGRRGLARHLARRAALDDPGIGDVVREQLPRLAVAAAGIRSATAAASPQLLVTYDEAGSWGRLVVAEGERLGVPVLDLPHAELVNPEILLGAGFDRIAVYGSASLELAAAAGVARDRVRVVGSVRHDLLEARARHARASRASGPFRLAFAAQYPTARLTDATLAAGLDATVQAAAGFGPAHVRIAPHPAGPAGLVERWLRSIDVPEGVAIEVTDVGGLTDALVDSDLLVTVASQSVLEAAVVGIPAVAIQPPGATYVFPYAREGIAAVAHDRDELAQIFTERLSPAGAAAAVERAREAVGHHLGPMDGRAAERSADLIGELLGRDLVAY